MRKNIIRFFAAGAAATLCAAISVTGKGATLTAEKPLAGITLSLEKYCDAVIEDIIRAIVRHVLFWYLTLIR